VKVRAEHEVSEKEKEFVKAELKAQIQVREELMRQLDRYLHKSEQEGLKRTTPRDEHSPPTKQKV